MQSVRSQTGLLGVEMDQTMNFLMFVLALIYFVSFVVLFYSALSDRRSPAARAVIIACFLPIVGVPLAAWYATKHPRKYDE
jgi:drug/metabolite transporter (DMT)-like permease